MTGPLAEGQLWSAARKREVVLRMLCGESVDALSRELNIEIYRLEQWREKALSGIDELLKKRQTDPAQAELDQAMRRIGELPWKTNCCGPSVFKTFPTFSKPYPAAGQHSIQSNC